MQPFPVLKESWEVIFTESQKFRTKPPNKRKPIVSATGTGKDSLH